MFDDWNRKCPKHPAMVHPCQICASPSTKIDPETVPPVVQEGVNWEAQGQIDYHSPQPGPMRKFNPSERYFEKHPEDAPDDEYPPPPPPIAPVNLV